MTDTTPAPVLPRFWETPGAYVTPVDGEDAGRLFRVARVLDRGPNRVSVELVDPATGEWGIAAPFELEPADGPDETD